MINKKKKKDTSFHISRLFPNMVTILGLCAGLSAVRFALTERWEWAVAFLVIASLIDAIDGRLARILNSTSEFGAQLDSLSDFMNFGVAPPLILYLWVTNEVKGLGWALVLFFAICSAIRLARFNTNLGKSNDFPSADRFFVGIPAPAGALLAVFPMVLTFQFQESFIELFQTETMNALPIFCICYAALIAIGMASRVPTYSLKKVTIRPESAAPILVIVGILAIGIITEPWLTLSLVGIVYLVSIPIGISHHQSLQHLEK